MSRAKRKAVTRTLQRLAVALLIVDAGVYFMLVWWMGNRVRNRQAQRNATYLQIRQSGQRIQRLEKTLAQLPETREHIASFEKTYVPSRRRGFSSGARLLRVEAQHSGVDLTDVNYRLNSEAGEPLDRLHIKVSAQGSYSSLISFAHSLETAGDFLVVREFSFQSGKNGALGLQLSADMYLTP